MVVRKRKKAANKKKNGKKDVKKLTVQQTIAYKEMGRDGICRVQEMSIPNVSGFTISTTSWRRMKTRMRSLKTGVIS